MGGLISFFGGTAFRWLLGALLEAWNKSADHKREIELMKIQFDQDAQRHQWQQDAIKAHADAGIKVIEAQSVSARDAASDAAFMAAVAGVNADSQRPDWVGKFNALIRPELAQVSIFLIAGNALFPQHVTLTPLVSELVCAVLGVFIGERITRSGSAR